MTYMRWLRPAVTFAFVLLLLANARSSSAQGAPPNDRTIETQLFQQAIGPGNFITVDAPDVNGHKQLGFGLSLNYQWRPYVIYTKETGVNAYVVEHQATAELSAAMALFDRLQVGISVPFTPLLQGQIIDTSGTPTGQNETARGFGDVRLEAKT